MVLESQQLLLQKKKKKKKTLNIQRVTLFMISKWKH